MAVMTEARPASAGVEAQEAFGFALGVTLELGRVAIEEAIDPAYAEGVRQEAWHDFKTSVQENVVISQQKVETAASADLRGRLKFDPMRVLETVDGYAVTSRGQRMRDLVGVGLDAARKKQMFDPRMDSEVERAENDIYIAELVDGLAPGEMIAVPSMEPLDAMDRDGDEFWGKVSIIGYKRGLAVIQVYYKDHSGRVHCGPYSVKNSNKAAFRRLWAENKVEIAPDTPANHMIRNVIRKKDVDLQTAQAFGSQLHDSYQKIVNGRADTISVTDVMQKREAHVRRYFDVYIEALGRALYTGQNNNEMRGLAQALLAKNADVFSSSDQATMMEVAYDDDFGRPEALFMENAVRYACARDIWNMLLDRAEPAHFASVDAGELATMANGEALARLHEMAANNVRGGVAIGWSGGGCAPTKFGDTEKEGAAKELGQQDVYGGTLQDSESGGESGACSYSIDACHCSPYDFDGNPLPIRVKVEIVRDKSGMAVCQRIGCGAKMDSKGVTHDWGDIFERAQEKRLSTMADDVLKPVAVHGLAQRIADSKEHASAEPAPGSA
ncbi:MAG TPA: hypothetical protein VGO07_07130 [Candidatus Saccharimonadales bacterium]|jgi:hypothetical protein|nr:hypothetical protein [Candidatus Saccharimonadales bacterium]